MHIISVSWYFDVVKFLKKKIAQTIVGEQSKHRPVFTLAIFYQHCHSTRQCNPSKFVYALTLVWYNLIEINIYLCKNWEIYVSGVVFGDKNG